MMRLAAKVDANQAEIVKALRDVCVTVEIIGKPLDLLVCCRGETMLLEVKNEVGGRYTKEQVEFLARWPGRVHVVRSPREAVAVVLGEKVMA